MPVHNPEFMTIDAKDLQVNAGYFQRKYGIHVGIEREPMCLGQWLDDGTTVSEVARSDTAEERGIR